MSHIYPPSPSADTVRIIIIIITVAPGGIIMRIRALPLPICLCEGGLSSSRVGAISNVFDVW